MGAREAAVGETVQVNYMTQPAVDGEPYDIEVAQFCEPESRLGGNWYCTTCGTGFVHNSASSAHADEPGDHVMVWICREHGPEARP